MKIYPCVWCELQTYAFGHDTITPHPLLLGARDDLFFLSLFPFLFLHLFLSDLYFLHLSLSLSLSLSLYFRVSFCFSMENPEESSPLIPRHSAADEDEKRATKPIAAPPPPAAAAEKHSPQAASGNPYWTADGLPLGHGSVMGEPMRRAQWDSSLFACLGRHDEFCSSDLEVCLLGSVAPCVLYGSNVERLGTGPGTFANHCLPYSGLFLIGNSIFGSNCLAPWFSYPSRTAIRRKFNLEGTCEALARSCGCCGNFLDDEVYREQCESACDFATHIFCHACALCQEGRELRRRLPHPGFNAQPVMLMYPPGEQTMGRGGA